MSSSNNYHDRAIAVPEEHARRSVGFGTACDPTNPESTDIASDAKFGGDHDTASRAEKPKRSLSNDGRVATPAKIKTTVDMISTAGPSNIFNPTRVRISVRHQNDSSDTSKLTSSTDQGNDMALLWRSRDNRKIEAPSPSPIPPILYLTMHHP
jgi:hypothetical protein